MASGLQIVRGRDIDDIYMYNRITSSNILTLVSLLKLSRTFRLIRLLPRPAQLILHISYAEID